MPTTSPEDRKQDNALATFISNLADSIDPSTATGAALWTPLPGPQTMAYDSLADETFYGGAAGGGKFVILGTNTLTPFGWKKIEDIKVGDAVIDVDGGTSKVLAVYPHQNKDMYRVTFIDGASVEVSDDHLWAWWKSSSKRDIEYNYVLHDPKKGVHVERAMHRLGTTQQLYEYHQKQVEKQKNGNRPYWIIMPLPDPVRFTRPSRTRQGDVIRIEPYLLGLLLGDGSITDAGLKITNTDEDIIQFVKTYTGDDIHWDGSKHLTFRGDHKEELRKQLESYGLWNTRSDTKFIPDAYLFASIDVRLDLVAGLIDTDGYIDDRGHISYTTVSEDLAKGFQHLVRSLGCKASITDKDPFYKDDDGNRVYGKKAYTVWVQGELSVLERFSRIDRKKSNIKAFNGGISEPGRRVTDIEYIGKGDGVCIAIDHPLGLHVVKDFIVTHNSDLLLGWALTRGYKSIIYRREYSQISSLVDRASGILRDTGYRWNGQDYTFSNIPGGRFLKFGSVPHADSVNKFQGRPHDFIGFDEISNFTEAMFIFLTTWNRTELPNVRTRIIGAGNPPTNVDGEWVIRRWAAWLDPQHGNPAGPGELRWYAIIDEKEQEFETGDPIEWKGETIYPTSRTFIPATLDDNPHYGAEYKARLQSLPPELRSKFLEGNFGMVFEDDPWQVIPSEFVKIGQERWHKLKADGALQRLDNVNPSFGLDPSEAGKDNNALCKITTNAVQWIKESDYSDLMDTTDWVVGLVGAQKYAPIAVDAIGVGAGIFYRLRQLNYKATGLKVQSKVKFRDRTGNMMFLNLRAYLWWLMRDALDPHGDIKLAIPPDVKLERELMAPRWSMTENGLVQVEKKHILRERLGRSPDRANALMMALYVAQVRRPPMRMM